MSPRPNFCALLSALLLAACGGGGGGGGDASPDPEPLTVEGAWRAAQLTAEDGSFVSRFGTFEFDAAGTVRASLTSNANGVVAPEPTANEGTYALDLDKMLEVFAPDAVTLLLGGLADDHSAGVAIGVVFGSDPTIMVQTRQTTASSTATLQGNYHCATAGLSLAVFSSFARATFDGNGLVDFQGDPALNFGGISVTEGPSLDHAYEVDADGTLRTSTPWRIGGTTADGEFAFTGGPGDQPSGAANPFLTAYVRYSTTADASTLRGTYTYVRFIRDGNSTRARIGDISADGAGFLTDSERTDNTDGFVTHTFGGGLDRTYTVGADGTLRILSTEFRAPLRGAVSPSGRYAILTVPGGIGFGPSLMLMMRRSTETQL